MSDNTPPGARTVAPPEEDPNAEVLCSSPPCFLHEIDPSYLGYLSRDEMLALLVEIRDTEWAGTLQETVRRHAMLQRHIDRIALTRGRTGRAGRGPDHPGQPRDVLRKLRDSLPRLYDDALRRDLEQDLRVLERGLEESQPVRRWEEVRAWRKAERATLIAQRLALPRDERARYDDAITALLRPVLAEARVRHLGFYWPFKGECDPRPLARALHAAGVSLALPVVEERARPLIFRPWRPGIPMMSGVWNIPVPAEGEPVLPEALLAPLVGFDAQGYRLGYGGGYYDRTLAAMPRKPLAIGVGFELSRLPTIHPQPHDVPMDLIVTERGVVRLRDAQARQAPVAEARP